MLKTVRSDPRAGPAPRHTSPHPRPRARQLGFSSLDELVASTVPASIRLKEELGRVVKPDGMHESEALALLRQMASKNKVRAVGAG